MINNIKNYIGKPDLTIVETLKRIDNNAKGILYIVDDKNNKLLGSVTDGDIRRYIIKTGNVNDNINHIYNRNVKYIFENEKNKAKEMFESFKITSIPIIDDNKSIVDVLFISDGETNSIRHDSLNSVPVIIMAGGKGTRLYPYTKILPKPLIPINEIPILVRILNKFNEYEINDFYITVNYLKGMIKSYFAENDFNYKINFIDENIPLGTAGSISLINEEFLKPVIVTNCDILINTDYDKLYNYHINMKNDITIVASLKNITIPYGVLEVEKDGKVVSMHEKPSISNFVNTGMYIVNPKVLGKIPKGKVFHMPDLAEVVLKSGGRVGIFPISEDSFLDMGEFCELKRMEDKLENTE